MSNSIKAKLLYCSFQTDKPIKYTHGESDTVSFSVEIPENSAFDSELDCFKVLQSMVQDFLNDLWKTYQICIKWETLKYYYKDYYYKELK